eukprot:TRINITY_DN104955_c0_g1_i1.p1 TRINITY_DN104955_c0_g1~~TRINITY_DN104955_c0_g1_i1.p1  ORF type:complete len:210 (-),score=54.42 TRINITY_DN104955_c0_g1_i1:2-562(-)
MCEVRAHAVTRRLRRGMDGLFPGRDLLNPPHTIITVALQTEHRQTAMSTEMLAERQEKFQQLVEKMTKLKQHMDEKDVWCDFIDPSSGAPFYEDSPVTLLECDEQYRQLGFEILELGCCRAVANEQFGQCLVMSAAFIESPPEDLADAVKLLEEGSAQEAGNASGDASPVTAEGAADPVAAAPAAP